MRSLRRGRREVYRVYEEEEYLAGADDEMGFGARASVASEGRARRVAGAAMLFGAVGAVGGLIVVSALSPSRGSRSRVGGALRVASGSAAAGGSLASGHVSRSQIWGALAVRYRPGREARRATRAAVVDRRVGPGERPHELALAPRRVLAPVPAVTVGAVPTDAAPIDAVSRGSVVPATARASAVPASVGHTEFGFER